ncbi:hypothetical protein B4U37_01655 [Sutcliffiella horikoshii]|uniref:Uncharacterized protein n=1 Tax=Sutcliffiella horikoshii TaxID=79883 RepID=A0A1Y0CHU6_9BACI|nr:hypothetical protein B4U37_01655 [Sutcliffiella horikoshii]TYS60741.1 hypothetical protein FZC74_00100 [Sutcliffiella horikoshii]
MKSSCWSEWKARRRPREEGTGETPQRSEEAHGPPAGKRSAWNGDQQRFNTKPKTSPPPSQKRDEPASSNYSSSLPAPSTLPLSVLFDKKHEKSQC